MRYISINSNVFQDIDKIRGFKITALNIGSLPAHIDELRVYMGAQTFHIQEINEARLDETISNGEVFIPGYSII